MVGQHVDIGAVGNGEDVGRHLRTALASVEFGTSVCVHRESLVGVDSDAEETGVGLLEDIHDNRRIVCDIDVGDDDNKLQQSNLFF